MKLKNWIISHKILVFFGVVAAVAVYYGVVAGVYIALETRLEELVERNSHGCLNCEAGSQALPASN